MTEKKRIYDEASRVDASDGIVDVDGPDAVDIKLTPQAAAETSDRLLRGAFKASGQKRMEHNPHRAKD
jgi:hypothetical protein